MRALRLDPLIGGATLVQLGLFFAITFALTWALFLPFVLGGVRWGSDDGQLLQALGVAAPSFTAFVLSAFVVGRGAAGWLARQGLRWRVGAGWYLFVLGWPGLAVLTALAVTTALGSPAPPPRLSPEAMVEAVVVGLLVGVFEEFGWMGFAFPRLQARAGFLWAGVALGVAVVLWHLPFFFIPGTPQAESSFGYFLAQRVLATILLGWIYNGTGGSVLLPILLHASWNAWAELLGPGPMLADPFGLTELAFLGLAVVTVLLVTRGAGGRQHAPEVIPAVPAAAG